MPARTPIFVTAFSNCPHAAVQLALTGSNSNASPDTVRAEHIVNFLQNISLQNISVIFHLSIVLYGALVLVLLVPIVIMLLDYLDFRRLPRVKSVFLEITPPSFSAKSAHATDQLFHVLYGLYSIRSLKDRLLRRKRVLSFEVPSIREHGIRFVVRLPADGEMVFRQTVASYLPSVKFKVIDDYIPRSYGAGSHISLMEFKQTRHFAYPLRSHDQLAKHDPIAYITGSLSKPEPGELVTLQVVLSPLSSREANRVRNKLLVGKEPGLIEFSWKLPFQLALKLLKVAVGILAVLLDGFAELFRPSYEVPSSRRRDDRSYLPVTPAAQKLTAKMLRKLESPLFRVNIRAFVVADSRQKVRERTAGLIGSLSSFSEPGYQGLVTHRAVLLSRLRRYTQYRLYKFINRLPATFSSGSAVLSAEELSSIYHFPYGETTQTENIVKSFSKTLAAPVAVKRHADNADFDVVLGVNRHHGSDTAIGLTADERQRHVYIIGGTGNGKTTMMEYAAVQDISSGKGVAMIDPHGDSAQKLLKYIPADRTKDVIYLNPRDLDYPIGLNLLEVPPGLSGSDLAHEKDLVTEAVISVLRKIFDGNGEANAYRIERVLRNAIHTALTVDDATLFTVLRLLTDKRYRKQVTKNLADESLKRFWKEELDKAGEFQRVKLSGGPITRIERYERSEAARRILGQTRSTINFEDILNSGKILICNFSKGRLGEDTSTLFGTTVLAKLQLAAWRRDDIPEDERMPFYLYVDEFQNFANEHFMGFYTEARKYKLFVTMAQQSVAQLQDRAMLTTILDNVGTMVAFRSKSPETEKLLLHQLSPYVEHGEIGNLPSYHFYMKIAAVEPQEPLSGETIVLPKTGADERVAADVIEQSRKKYGVKYDEAGKKPKDGIPSAEHVSDEAQDESDGLPELDAPAV